MCPCKNQPESKHGKNGKVAAPRTRTVFCVPQKHHLCASVRPQTHEFHFEAAFPFFHSSRFRLDLQTPVFHCDQVLHFRFHLCPLRAVRSSDARRSPVLERKGASRHSVRDRGSDSV